MDNHLFLIWIQDIDDKNFREVYNDESVVLTKRTKMMSFVKIMDLWK